MPRYTVGLIAHNRDSVVVEADSPEEARAIAEADDFTYQHALDFSHDLDPEFEVVSVELDE